MQEKEHILSILKEAKKAAKSENVFVLKSLSNQTIHAASIYEDNDNIMIAVLIYSLGKLIERKRNFNNTDFQEILDYYLKIIDDSIFFITKKDIDSFSSNLKTLIQKTNTLSKHLKESLQDMFKKAQINKASKVYEHGISIEKTANLLGISIWEIVEYTGQSSIHDQNLTKTMDIKKRIKTAIEIFS
ncbi:MAG TPA: hypothetical protein P5277_01975 [Candidatus Paceibacterota bacterium]|nr:hypothetical protein [Candidatus Paceibacterota bacterium]